MHFCKCVKFYAQIIPSTFSPTQHNATNKNTNLNQDSFFEKKIKEAMEIYGHKEIFNRHAGYQLSNIRKTILKLPSPKNKYSSSQKVWTNLSFTHTNLGYSHEQCMQQGNPYKKSSQKARTNQAGLTSQTTVVYTTGYGSRLHCHP